MTRGRIAATACALLAGLALAACDPRTVLVAGPADARDEHPAEVAPDDDGNPPDDAEADDGGHPEDGDDGLGPSCPIWVSTVRVGDTEDGSRAHPKIGLQSAIDGRGRCGHLVLVAVSGAPPFDLALDVELASDDDLLLEGEPGSSELPELAGAGDAPGVRAWGAGDLEFRNLYFHHGQGPSGGCLEADVATLRLTGTQWANCAALSDGGAVAVRAATVAVTDSVFLDNNAGKHGGALVVDNWTTETNITVDTSEFRRNRAEEGGAVAILVPSTSVAITNTLFADNDASWAGAAIGGYVGGRILGNRFASNRGSSGGGAVAGQAGSAGARIAQNVFVQNTVIAGIRDPERLPLEGAAIALSPAFVTIHNNIFERNVADRGRCPGPGDCPTAAVRLEMGRTLVVNNTFADNTTREGPTDDLCAAHLLGRNGEVDIRNNIFAGGTGCVGVAPPSPPAGWHALDYDDLWAFDGAAVSPDAVLGTGILELNPVFLDAAAGDYRLADDSPCIDAGDPSADFRDADGTRNDMGAFGGPTGRWTPMASGDE